MAILHRFGGLEIIEVKGFGLQETMLLYVGFWHAVRVSIRLICVLGV